ncbi:MAG: hypothetical protein V1694_01550 [Candidatus Eisenbacteria bacterium]
MQALRIAATEMTLGIFHLTRLNKRLETGGYCGVTVLAVASAAPPCPTTQPRRHLPYEYSIRDFFMGGLP